MAYPGYTGPIDVSGSVTVSFPRTGSLQFAFELDGLEENCVDCGIHIHTGTTCSVASEVGGHYFREGTVDPWTTAGGAVYNSDGNGEAMGVFSVTSGFDTYEENLGHAVVIHAQDGTRLACGILVAGELI